MILYLGDAKEKLKRILPNSVDAVVTDPPYGLSFMGKKWDYDVPTTELWREVFRVLKPGGHLLAFFGTRTYHRGVVRIEDAGFEIRDQIQWIYGSGFPKSHNLKDEWQGWGTALKPANEIVCMARKPLTDADLLDNLARECLSLLFASIARKYLASSRKGFDEASNIARWLAGESTLTQEDLSDLMATLQSGSETNSSLSTELSWLDTLGAILAHVSTFTIETASSLTTDLKILKSCLSKNTQASTPRKGGHGRQSSASHAESLLSALALKLNFILEPSAQDLVTSQDEEKALHLNPSSNPIVLARKPLEKGLTVAENVLKWGTGGLNIDACRVGDFENKTPSGLQRFREWSDSHTGQSRPIKPSTINQAQGRWPANVIFDEAAAVMLDAQSGNLGVSRGGNSKNVGNKIYRKYKDSADGKTCGFGDSGGASRFFYVAKASKRERNAGLEGMPKKKNDFQRETSVLSKSGNELGKTTPNENYHPTVKPIKLMKYLCKLITPPNGVVLDPFMGSGSTGVAAKHLGFRFIGIELNEEYFEIAKRRIKHAEGKCLEVSNG